MLMLPQGILLVFLFTALHETIHETAFRTQQLNRALALVAGSATLLSPLHFRYFHFAHHHFTHDPERDPELATPSPETPWQYVWYLTGLPDWYGRTKTLLKTAVREPDDHFVPLRARHRITKQARAMLLFYALVLLLALPTVLWVWLLPLLLGGPFLRAYLLAEHHLCPHVSDMLSNTRTTFTNRLVRWVAWNMPYHTEHHAYPAVPFHNLPAFHAITAPHLRETERGYTRFNGRMFSTLQQGG